MPVFGVRTMEDYFASRVVTTTRLLVGSVSGMGSMGLALAMVGLYALATYAVGRRTREIGIRMAVGAAPSSVLRMVLRQGVLLAMVGIVTGLAACAGVNALLRANFRDTLFQTQGIDLSTYVLVIPALIVVVMVAAYIPARRAARIDPLVALRTE
jgi:ABC-type antimicrobial peptide transport system permease subunit